MPTPAKPSPIEPLMTVAQVSELTGWSRSFIYDLARNRRLEVIRLGPRSMRFRRSVVVKLLESNTYAEAKPGRRKRSA